MQTELGTEGVIELTQWFERMETVFRISNCLAENQVKFATCTLLAGALTWWNSHIRIVSNDVAYVMTWIELKKKMADKYCPRNEIKKIKTGFWNLEVQGTDVTRSVAASKPKTMQEATEMATGLMDKKSTLMRKGRLQTRECLKTLPETTKADSSLLKGKMWQGHTLQDLAVFVCADKIVRIP
nr:reverse transcriptase domain-containing protein [Tanacetum cinerariifolium]GFB92439.1 reverse transcriptase domain-containing protein [Tanacetum cinerariifolium]